MTDHRTFPVTILDVFAEKSLAGNQLAVVHNAHDLNDAEMQAIALEMNFSETTFITARDDARATVRIFTPAGELPFAGHPTIGTAWEITRGRSDIVLDLAVGAVPVNYDAHGVGWLTSPPVESLGEVDATAAAAVVGLTANDFVADLPVAVMEVGPRFLMLPLNNCAALKTVSVDSVAYKKLNADTGVQCIFLFTADAHFKQSDYAARMFFDNREDAATGSANAALAAYLKKHCHIHGRVVVDQGVEMKRPSRIYLNINEQNNALQVGGKVRPVLRGEIKPFAEPE